VYVGENMAILNFGFTKIDVEKKEKVSKQISIKSGLNITAVGQSEMVSGTKQQAFNIKFSFDVQYEPNVGHIKLQGDIMYLADESLSKEIVDSWKEKKSLPKPVALVVFNRILHNCNVEALILSREINLPAPIQLPKIKAEETAKN
jgi:hypothetical protein